MGRMDKCSPGRCSAHGVGLHRIARQWAQWSVVSVAYVLMTLIATYPALKSLGSNVIGRGDTLQNLWNLWWVPWVVSHRGKLFFTSMLYHPDGVSLAYHTLSPFNGLLSILFHQMLDMNLVLTYNVIALLSFVGSGLSMFVLGRSITGSSTAAFVAGVVFVFCPFRTSRVYYGNLQLYSTQFIPLLVLFLDRMTGRLGWRSALAAAVALSLTAWCSRELAFGAAILSELLLVFNVIGVKEWKLYLRRWIIFALVTCILVSPIVVAMLRDSGDFADQSVPIDGAISNSADLLGFVVPDRSSMFTVLDRAGLGVVTQASRSLYSSFQGNACEKTVFVGYTVILMTVVSLVVGSRAVHKWGLIAIVFLVLCLGPVLHIAGETLWSMPYRVFFWIPLLKFGRSPSRLALFVMLALAMVVALGCSLLERKYQWFSWVTLLIGGVIFVEFLVVPMRLDAEPANIPSYYYQLADRDRDDGAILDIPIDLYGAQGPAARYMLYQTVHERPIVSGYISRTPSKVLYPFDYPFLYELRARIYGDTDAYEFSPEMLAEGLEDVRKLDVQLVILHKDVLSQQDWGVIAEALNSIMPTPEFQDDVIAVWRVPADGE